jgi:hypothetical protein
MPMDQLVNIALAVAIIVVQVLLIKLTLWLYKRWKFSLTRFTLRKAIRFFCNLVEEDMF